MLRGLLDESRDGLIVLDENGAILEANAAAARLVGHDRTRLVGKPLAVAGALADRRRLRRELGRLGRGEQVVLELKLLHGDEPCSVSLRALQAAPRRVAVALSPDQPIVPRPTRPPAAERLEFFVLRFPYAVVALHRDLRVAFANVHARAL